MLIGERTLHIGDEGLAHGCIGGELDGSAGYEGAGRHDNGVLVTGHIPGLGGDKAVNGRRILNAAAQRAQALGRAHFDGLDDIGTGGVISRGGFHPQLFKHTRGQHGGFERLRYGVRRHEQALIEGLIGRSVAAHFAADTRGSQARFDAGNGFGCAYDIAARRSQTAADIFDEAANDDVRAQMRGLMIAHECTVAVVHHDADIRTGGMQC